MIEFQNLTKRFGERTILEDVSLTVDTGNVLFVVGASGTGKSVLMRHLIGLLRPDAGRVLLDGDRVDTKSERELVAVRKQCGFVFQHPTLFDYLTVLDNVALPLIKCLGMRRPAARARAMDWLQRVGVEEVADRKPADLGDGITKRAAIARTLTLEPRYVVYDEPTTGLDPVNARRIDALIRELADNTGVTSIVVSHDLTSIFGISDDVAFLYDRKVYFFGPTSDFRGSKDPLVHQFVTGAPTGPMKV